MDASLTKADNRDSSCLAVHADLVDRSSITYTRDLEAKVNVLEQRLANLEARIASTHVPTWAPPEEASRLLPGKSERVVLRRGTRTARDRLYCVRVHP